MIELEKIEFDLTDSQLELARAQSGAVEKRADYDEQVWQSWQSILPHIPLPTGGIMNILDIGCGLAGIDVYLHRFYDGKASFLLVDGDELEDIPGGYRARSRFASRYQDTYQLLNSHGLAGAFEYYFANLVIAPNINLCLSLFSWGYHYPLETYLWEIKPLMTKGGTIIIDLYATSFGLDLFRQNLIGAAVIKEIPAWNATRVVGFKA